jgi:hypothetical protein
MPASRYLFDATPQRLIVPPAPPKRPESAPVEPMHDDGRCPDCLSNSCRGRCAPDIDRPPRWERW